VEEASPVVAKPAALPGDDGARLDEDEDISPASPSLGQPRPEQSIGDLGAGPGRAPLVDGELVAQREHLELEGGSRSEARAERPEEGEENCLHEERRLPHLGRTHRDFRAGRPSAKLRVDSRFAILGTDKVLHDIGAAEVPSLLLLNKVDRLDEAARRPLRERYPGAVMLSAYSPEDVAALRQSVLDFFEAQMVEADLLIP
jgi:hypothetical protein